MSTYPPEAIAPWNIPPDTEIADSKVKHQGLLLELKKVVCLIEFDEGTTELHLRVKPYARLSSEEMAYS